MGYDTMPDKELKQKVRWDLYLLILRAMAMFFMAAEELYFILVPLMAVLLAYLEVWPERAISAAFGNPSRLWEYDPCNPRSNRRYPEITPLCFSFAGLLWRLLATFRTLFATE